MLDDETLRVNTNRIFARLLPKFEDETVEGETDEQLYTRLQHLFDSGIIQATTEETLATLKSYNDIADIESYRVRVADYARKRYHLYIGAQWQEQREAQ